MTARTMIPEPVHIGSEYQVTTLKNGVRIATAEMPHMRSACVSFWVGVGGRHEREQNVGISHFLEHLLFKGTARRNARAITEAVEGIGGYLNAFTTEDHTCYYAKAAANHLGRLCDVLGDMFIDSEFPEVEIERERDVIREEILMYRDQPSEHSRELLSSTLWPNHPLGRPLTGTIETINTFQREQLMGFHKAHYCGRTSLVAVAGRVKHSDVVAMLEPSLSRLPSGRKVRFEKVNNGAPLGMPASISVAAEDTEQTHVAMGFHAMGRNDERRFALKLLSVILGENMSSRLFQKLRERHGYCYNVCSSVVTLEDTGALCVQAGVDPAKVKPSMKMIMSEIRRICDKAPTRTELQNAKDYTIGQTLISLESTTNQAMWMGESLINYGRVMEASEVEQRLNEVKVEDVQKVACETLCRGRLAVALVGEGLKKDEILGWLA